MARRPPGPDTPPPGTPPPDSPPPDTGARPQLSPEEFEQRSLEELAAGRLPLRAQQRLADMRSHQAWTSDLSVNEFDAIGSVGFRPVGQVMGSSVYQIGWAGTAWCGAQRGWFASGWSPSAVEATPLMQAMYDARQRALLRMRAEAQALGADGVVGVELIMEPFLGAPGSLEFQVIGTAVRAEGGEHAPYPFLSDLSGQDFAKLISGGYVPTGLAMGVSVVVRHDDYRTRSQAASWSNTEIAGYTQLIQETRHLARERLRQDVLRLGGEGVVVREMQLRIHEQECRSTGQDGQRDHIAEATVIGTSVARFGRSPLGEKAPMLPILRLGGSSKRSDQNNTTHAGF